MSRGLNIKISDKTKMAKEVKHSLSIIDTCKQYIEENNIDYLKESYKQIMDSEHLRVLDWPFIFQKLYLHACLKRKPEIAEWFEKTLFPLMDPIQQVALRQTFPYGRYLLGKVN